MKKLFMTTAAALMLTTATVSVHSSTPVEASVHAYYNYSGYAGQYVDTSFVLSETFVDAVKVNNLTLNGYTIDSSHEAYLKSITDQNQSVIKKYDQSFVLNGEDEAIRAFFEVKGSNINKSSIVKAYGTPTSTMTSSNSEIEILYYTTDEYQIVFELNDNQLRSVTIGGSEAPVS